MYIHTLLNCSLTNIQLYRNVLRKSAQAVMLPACIWEIQITELSWDTNYSGAFFGFPRSPKQCPN